MAIQDIKDPAGDWRLPLQWAQNVDFFDDYVVWETARYALVESVNQWRD